jgi:hypothetical protein
LGEKKKKKSVNKATESISITHKYLLNDNGPATVLTIGMYTLSDNFISASKLPYKISITISIL